MDKMQLAYTYYIGDGYTFDRLKALEIYEELAKEGNIKAMYYSGKCLEYLGKRNKNNYIKAYEYYKKAAELNCIDSIEIIKTFKEDYNL